MAPVKLFVYDLSKGMARAFSSFTGRQIDGIWHTSVVVHGKEWYFGPGIINEIPGQTILGPPLRIIYMGETEVTEEIIHQHIKDMRVNFTPEKYHLLDNNCNNFSNLFCEFLTGRNIPDYITNLPADFLSTPMGRHFRPMLEIMFGPSRHP
ncbi:PPPDE putative peptidase domain-containing protein [Glomus cerebriforme]|uniref:PPPDE putative peptidase domain-containing protein n=1 Tax=Glomus cerebriforme TaxID=658196 RepID=A0A397TJS7_9GLOM|nr:PPPDE putative peptidase domain-containing protein [Glomus cerebriforme]